MTAPNHNLYLVTDAIRRKARARARNATRFAERIRADEGSYRVHPPVLMNTIPKSGTHLLYQVCAALPGVVDRGSMIATTPPIRHRPRSERALMRRIRATAPQELVRSHLWFSAALAQAARSRNMFIIFLVRDPRAIVVSEAKYLADGAPWHALHRQFRKLDSDEQLLAAIRGLPDRWTAFPDIGSRLRRYAAWADLADIVIRFEDLRHDRSSHAVADIVERFHAFSDGRWGIGQAVESARQAMDPTASHTFRKGEVDSWKVELTAEMIELTGTLTADFIQRFGYST